MMSQQDRPYKTYCQLVKFQYNFLEYFAIYVRSVYLQNQIDFNIKHVCQLLIQKKNFTLL